MDKPSPRQLQREFHQFAARANPICIEHFDAWAVIGVRPGDYPVALRLLTAVTPELKERIENEVIALAQHILCERKNHGG